MTGTLAELSEARTLLGDVFELIEASEPYPNRGGSKLHRVYVEAEIRSHTTSAGAPHPSS
ncbi:hypothetical protein [Nocardia sp. CY41]|uniref:hypothetical protein n=1 Tax=Nocardia sp. CY41 TaxID=2608686 RepID=UPI001F3F7858|nr:hypothetical protein [Nocardia sp. CY41]